MSVILFSSAELANVAAFLTSDRYSTAADLDRACANLAAYSRGNAAAYNVRYSEKVKGASAKEIKLEAAKVILAGGAKAGSARGTIRLLDYNGPEGEGAKAPAGYHKALSQILATALSRLESSLEAAA